MFIKSILLSTLVVAGMVNAQTRACSAQKNELKTQADVAEIAECQTLEGDVIVGEGLASLELPNLQQIKGSFQAEDNDGLVSINFPSLRIISKDFKLRELINLSNLNCPQLTTVGTISWVKLPELRSMTFTRKITEATSILISDTRLDSLEGIDLRTVQSFRIDNNKQLKSVKVGLRNVTEELILEFNSKSVEIEFPELIWAANITVRDASSIKLPKLQHINGTMSFEENSFTSVECKQLEVVDESLAFIENPNLTELEFPNLVQIGGAFKCANNTKLEEVNGFPKLEQVEGAIDFSGSFTEFTLPALESVFGGFHLQTTQEFDCSAFDDMQGSVIQGDDYTCEGKVANPETKDGTPSGGSNDDEEDDKGAAGKLAVGSILGLAIVATFFSF